MHTNSIVYIVQGNLSFQTNSNIHPIWLDLCDRHSIAVICVCNLLLFLSISLSLSHFYYLVCIGFVGVNEINVDNNEFPHQLHTKITKTVAELITSSTACVHEPQCLHCHRFAQFNWYIQFHICSYKMNAMPSIESGFVETEITLNFTGMYDMIPAKYDP